MKKIFISQPMRGRTNEEIKNERMEIKNQMEDYFKEGIEVLDSFFEDAPHDAKPVWYLAKSLEVMSNADVVVFAEGWDKAIGCLIEHAVATAYGMTVNEIFENTNHSPVSIKKCHKCKKQVGINDKYCTFCGTRLF